MLTGDAILQSLQIVNVLFLMKWSYVVRRLCYVLRERDPIPAVTFLSSSLYGIYLL